ncbi:MAG: ATP-binding protein [Pirellulales bacterium]
MLSKWPIRAKLVVGLCLLLVIVATLSWGGIHGLYAYRSLVRSLSRRVHELPLANALSQSVSELRLALSEAVPAGPIAASGQRDYGAIQPGSVTGQDWAWQEFQLQLDQVERNLGSYRDQLEQHKPRPQQSVSAEELEGVTGEIGDSRREWQTVRSIEGSLLRIGQLNRQRDWLIDPLRVARLSDELETLQTLAARLPSFLYSNIEEFTAEARRQYRTLLVLTWITSLLTVLLVALFVKLGYAWIFRPLRVLINGSRKVASGHFNYRIRLTTEDEMSELAAAMNDMTARFRAIRDDLDRQVQERTKQVVRSEQLASVGFLAAGVAHEINNPLASIAMCAESLEGRLHEGPGADGPQREVARQYLRMIQAEAFRCKEITEKLLDFSRIGEVKRQSADLGELVQGVIDMIGHLGKYQEKHVEFAPDQKVIVPVNSQEIKQVVLNLLTNALDSLDAGGTVSVELAERGGEAELTVTDNGCGMTPEVLEHLFEPFFTRRRGGQGTGLGLSIAYRIIADHEGSIEVHSDGPGHGSWFCVRLPLAAGRQENRHRYQAA